MRSDLQSKKVAAAVKEALDNKNLAAGVLQFGKVRILVSKGSRLRDDIVGETVAADYPDNELRISDNYDTWLR
jgi:hypothetical protein